MAMPKREPTKLVPVPSTNIIPERDVDKAPILECRHLGIDFGGLTAVDEFNLTVGKTEIAGLIGPNGAGKTTVFNLLTKVYQPTHGTILLNGKETSRMNTVQVNRAGIARTFQNIRLFPSLTVEENVAVGMDTSGKTTAQINRMGIARTFQNIRLFSNMSVADNVKVGLHNQVPYSTPEGDRKSVV